MTDSPSIGDWIADQNSREHTSPFIQTGVGVLRHPTSTPEVQLTPRDRTVSTTTTTDPRLTGTTDEIASALDDRLVSLVDMHKAMGQSLAANLEGGYYTDEGAKQATAKFVQSHKFEAELDKILADADAVANRAEKALSTAITTQVQVTGSVQQQLLTEMQDTKAWARVQAEVQGHDTAHAKLNALGDILATTEDPAARRVILAEARAWLLNQGLKESHLNVDEYLRARLIESDANLRTLHTASVDAQRVRDTVSYNASKLRSRLTSAPPTFSKEHEGNEPTRRGHGYVTVRTGHTNVTSKVGRPTPRR